MISIRYKILFTIELQHEYFLDGKCSGVDVIPSPATVTLLNDRKLKWRQMGNKMIVLVQVNDDNTPKLPLDSSDVYRFFLVAANRSFFNYSNLPYTPGANKRYYFSNLANNKIGTSAFLSKPITAYSSADAYLPGDMAVNGTGDVFEALKKNDSGDAHNLSQTTFWRKRTKQQYPVAKDMITCTTGNTSFALSAPANDVAVSLFKMNPATGNFDLKVTEDKELHFPAPVSTVIVDSSAVEEGVVRREVNAQSDTVYAAKPLLLSSGFAVVEMFNHLALGNDYSFFDNTGKVQEKTFIIRFANRSVLWKYMAKTNEVTAIKDADNNFQWSNDLPLQFTSNVPIPLSEKPYQSFLLESSRLGEIRPIKNAATDRINTMTKDGSPYFFSEIYLNY